ncbi:hypothetical protein WDL1P1_00473 (plasmid) [Variovorax sp. WDL1]|nr:hypothetical protein WDL1P1_00473 [Variovorax sp. WDL1]
MQGAGLASKKIRCRRGRPAQVRGSAPGCGASYAAADYFDAMFVWLKVETTLLFTRELGFTFWSGA